VTPGNPALNSGFLKLTHRIPYLSHDQGQRPQGAGATEAGAGFVADGRRIQGRFEEGFAVSRMSLLSSPLLLGFEEMERLIDRVGKGGDGYPPYNIERISVNGAGDVQSPLDRLRITLAVAGFRRDQLEITIEENQLVIRGRQEDDKSRQFIHRGIAARQFSRSFVLAEGIEVKSADLQDGLLRIDLVRREPERLVRKIEIGETKA
jgi:HSP20 family molecular chaperone IbpA